MKKSNIEMSCLLDKVNEGLSVWEDDLSEELCRQIDTFICKAVETEEKIKQDGIIDYETQQLDDKLQQLRIGVQSNVYESIDWPERKIIEEQGVLKDCIENYQAYTESDFYNRYHLENNHGLDSTTMEEIQAQ